MDNKTETVIEHVVKGAHHDSDKTYAPGKGYSRIMGEYLEPGELMVFGARQSRLISLSPALLLATNKKLVFLKPSFWRLHTGHVLFGDSDIQFIPYHTIMSISFARGRYMSSISIKTLGAGIISVGGLKIKEARRLLDFVEGVVERAPGA